jgi:hypothetical protein
VLIISGGDLVGKSTVVRLAYKALEERGYLHMPLHLTRPPRHFDYYRGYLHKIDSNLIWDRFMLDAIPYRVHDDRECSLTPMKYSLVEAACRKAGGYQVVLTCEREQTIEERYRASRPGETHMYDVEHAKSVNNTFNSLCEHTRKGYAFVMRGADYRPRIDFHTTTDDRSPEAVTKAVVDAYVIHFEDWRRTVR